MSEKTIQLNENTVALSSVTVKKFLEYQVHLILSMLNICGATAQLWRFTRTIYA